MAALATALVLLFPGTHHPHPHVHAPRPPRPVVHHHHRHRRPTTVRAYAEQLVLRRWHSIGEWRALDRIITPESGWDPCAHYPSSHDCFYQGSNACGIPQRDPCPYGWRGRLYVTRWAQVRNLMGYIGGRYGDPYRALAYREAHGTY